MKNKQQGFSMLEIIVAMTMLSLIMAMIYAGIHTSREMAHKGTQRINATNEIRVIQELVRRQVSRLLPMAFKEEDGEFIIFDADQDKIMFVAPMPGYLGQGGPHVQLIEILQENDGKILQFSHWFLGDSFDEIDFEETEQEPIVLLEGIQNASFSFVKLDEFGRMGEWETEWENGETTPLMVKLDIDLKEDSMMKWPSLQVALMMDATSINRRVSQNLLKSRHSQRRAEEGQEGRTQ